MTAESPAPEEVRPAPWWRRVWAGPTLPPEVRARIAERLVRTVMVPLALVAGAGLVIVALTTGMTEPTRWVPSTIIYVGLLPAIALRRRAQWLASAGAIIGAVTLGASYAGLANGVGAPAYWSALLLPLVILPLYGVRTGLLFAGVVSGAGALRLAAEGAGLVGLVTPPHPALDFGLLVCFLLVGLVFVATPTDLLGQALRASRASNREAEAARQRERESELAFRAVFDHAAGILALVDAAGDLVELNRTGAMLLEVDQDEVVGLPLVEASWWTADQRLRVASALERAAAGATSIFELARGTGAEERVFTASISPFRGASGGLRYLILEMTEVTELVSTRQQLGRARRLEALGQLAGGVAHDFNNMLGAILSASEMLRSDPALIADGEREELTRIIDDAGHRASALTRKLLAFGRRDRFASERVDMVALLQSSGRLLERTLGGGVQVELDLCTGPCTVRGDGSALEHALLNLAVNARDAMPEGGVLTLRSRSVSLRRGQHGLEGGAFLQITVQDTGTGIPEDVYPHIFEPFYTTKPEGEGTGLGLAAVHGTVTSHGGAVSVDSEAGVGTSFHLFFPRVQEVADAARAPAAPGGTTRFSGRVLVVDDERVVRRATAVLLRRLGLEVVAAGDGEEALTILQEDSRFDLVLADLVMRGLDGYGLARALEAEYPDLPVALMTGFTQGDVHGKLPTHRQYPMLRKPFQREEVVEVLRGIPGLAAAAV